MLIVFANSDINAALYHLVKSLESPFNTNAVATVLVQESIKEDFIQKLQQEWKSKEITELQSNSNFKQALETAMKLNARIITPSLVCDFTHEHFSSGLPNGIVTLHTFRTAKEAFTLVNKESIKFETVSIWHENHSYAYEIIAALKSSYYFINCFKDSAVALKEANLQSKNCVSMDKSYHYETLDHEGVQKYIVFPIGSIFAN